MKSLQVGDEVVCRVTNERGYILLTPQDTGKEDTYQVHWTPLNKFTLEHRANLIPQHETLRPERMCAFEGCSKKARVWFPLDKKHGKVALCKQHEAELNEARVS